MKRLFGLVLAGALLVGGASAFAQCGKCGAKGEAAIKGEAAAKGEIGGCFAKLKLTDDQKAKIADLKADCAKGGCPVAAKSKMDEGLKSILTADQYKQWQVESAKMQKEGGCPAMKAKT